jgi:hypothetical protein
LVNLEIVCHTWVKGVSKRFVSCSVVGAAV